jgi:hypothetical protein
VLMVREGRIAGEAAGAEMTEENMIALASDISEASRVQAANLQLEALS